jgi:arginyl-tRNA synthetase
MNSYDTIQDYVKTIVFDFTKITNAEIDIKQSKYPSFDVQFATFKIAATTAPQIFTKNLVDHVTNTKYSHIVNIKQYDAFVHIKFDPKFITQILVAEYLDPCPINPERKDKIIVEFSSPNTNKPLHLGHVRNNCLGTAIANMLKYAGHNVQKFNLINDRGIHICKSMLMYKYMDNKIKPDKKGDHFVGDLYKKYEECFQAEYISWLETTECKEEYSKVADKISFSMFKSKFKHEYSQKYSILGSEISTMLKLWEENDPETRELWAQMNGWVMAGFNQTYDAFGISFDVIEKESDIYLHGKRIIYYALAENKLIKMDDGSIVCDLVKIGLLSSTSTEKHTKTLLRSNGTSIYLTQDIAVAILRLEKYTPNKMIYVVGDEQKRHFEILFKLLEHINGNTIGIFNHLSYGMVELPDGKMKSREGTAVDADDLLIKISNMVAEIVKKKWENIDNAEITYRSNIIALAAIKFYLLMFTPNSKINFDIKKSLSFTGESGPYLLYQYVRIKCILAKLNITSVDSHLQHFHLLSMTEEANLMIKLCMFPNEIKNATRLLDPSKIIAALYAIAQSFSAWYGSGMNIVNCDDNQIRSARVSLIIITQKTIERGASICGIELLDKM